MHDLRDYVRWKVNKLIKIRLNQEAGEFNCLVKDINLKGMQLMLKEDLVSDSRLMMEIIFTEVIRINVECWVVWQKDECGFNVYGVNFNKLTYEDKQKIHKFTNMELANKEEVKEKESEEFNRGGVDMEGTFVEDRRVFERFAVKLPVRFVKSGSEVQEEALTYNISAKGVGMTVKEEISQDSDLEIWLDIPDQAGPLYARGKVAWVKEDEANEYKAGINFEKADLMGVSRALRAVCKIEALPRFSV